MSRKARPVVIGSCIKRAANEVQARTKKWWLRHSDADQSVAIVNTVEEDDPNFLLCGVYRETDPKTGNTEDGILYTPLKRKTRSWYCAIPNPIQVDTDEGTSWETLYSIWEIPVERYTLVQSALLAASGMPDDELAALLKVNSSTIKKWYTGKAEIPLKVIKIIVKKFL